jgi:hypothetical protein
LQYKPNQTIMKAFLWVLCILGVVAGSFYFIVGIASADGAPERTAAAVIGLASAAIPYILARAVSAVADNK